MSCILDTPCNPYKYLICSKNECGYRKHNTKLNSSSIFLLKSFNFTKKDVQYIISGISKQKRAVGVFFKSNMDN